MATGISDETFWSAVDGAEKIVFNSVGTGGLGIWDVLNYAKDELIQESLYLAAAGEITWMQHEENAQQVINLISHWENDEDAAWAAVKQYEPGFLGFLEQEKKSQEQYEKEEALADLRRTSETEVRTEAHSLAEGGIGEFTAVTGLRDYAMDAADEFGMQAYGYSNQDLMWGQLDGARPRHMAEPHAPQDQRPPQEGRDRLRPHFYQGTGPSPWADDGLDVRREQDRGPRPN